MTDIITDPDVVLLTKQIKELGAENTRLKRSEESYRRNLEHTQSTLSNTRKELAASYRMMVDGVQGDTMPYILPSMQSKILRQKDALNILNKKVRGQRLHLRYINELGRQLTPQEWAEAKAKYPEALEYTEE